MGKRGRQRFPRRPRVLYRGQALGHLPGRGPTSCGYLAPSAVGVRPNLGPSPAAPSVLLLWGRKLLDWGSHLTRRLVPLVTHG